MEAVLSGTLNFIFNTISSEIPLSKAILMAKEAGFSEPDPRIDLSGKDVIRKLVILAREAGHLLEFKDIRIKPLIPRSLLAAKSIDGFFELLPGIDEEYARLRDAAAAEGKVLRYVASFADGKAGVSLMRVGPDHPTYALSGSEIILALTTTNCHDHPVVIRGPGAGADVTATGVFADIIRIAHHQG